MTLPANNHIIILDVETTGLDHSQGDRIIEIACVEMIDGFKTGKIFDHRVNPQRSIPPESYQIHGISDDDLKSKPLFSEIADDFLDFIGDTKLVAHNMSFDSAFINSEFERCNRPPLDKSRLIDSLEIARKLYPGKSNSLDALKKRFKIDIDRGPFHGALTDAEILAEIYLRLTDNPRYKAESNKSLLAISSDYTTDLRPDRGLQRATDAECAEHEIFIRDHIKGPTLWLFEPQSR